MTNYEGYADNVIGHYFPEEAAAETDYTGQMESTEVDANHSASEKAVNYCASGYTVETGY